MIPKVEIEAGKADLIREILGVNDLQDINLLDEYRDIISVFTTDYYSIFYR